MDCDGIRCQSVVSTTILHCFVIIINYCSKRYDASHRVHIFILQRSPRHDALEFKMIFILF